jgi:hypothetical protein
MTRENYLPDSKRLNLVTDISEYTHYIKCILPIVAVMVGLTFV